MILLVIVFYLYPIYHQLCLPQLTLSNFALLSLLSNASLHSSKFFLNSSIVSPIRTRSFAKNLLHPVFPCVFGNFTYHHCKQQRILFGVNRLSQKILLTAPIPLLLHFHSDFVQTHQRLDHDFRQTLLSHSPNSITLPGIYSAKCLFQVNKTCILFCLSLDVILATLY